MHIQKALDQMNLQVHRVLTEITGLSGLRILDAILAGERDPLTLARLSRIVYHLLSTREQYDESVFHRCEEEALKRAEMRLRRQAAHLGFRIIPAEEG